MFKRVAVVFLVIVLALAVTAEIAGPSRVAFTISGCRVNTRFPLPLEGKEVIQEDGRVIIKGLVGTGG